MEPEQLNLPFGFPLDSHPATNDPINHPSHYTMGGIEVYDFIRSWELSFAEGNVIKYVVRAPHKGKELQDLKKARWYLEQLIKDAEGRHG